MPTAVGIMGTATMLISASLPTSYDDDAMTGYPSVSMTALGEVVDIGAVGRSYNLVTHSRLGNRGITKLKGQYNEGSVTISMARDDDDAGQVLALAALSSDNDYTFEIAYADGESDFFAAKVMSFQAVNGGLESIVSRSMVVEITRPIVTATT